MNNLFILNDRNDSFYRLNYWFNLILSNMLININDILFIIILS
jgi:hypothetical protein